MITDAELADLRAVHTETLADTATVQTRTSTSDGAGGTKVGWADTSTVPCRIAGMSGATREALAVAGAELAGRSGWTITVPHGTTVRPGDRLVVGTRAFAVLAVPEPTYATALRLPCGEETA